MTPAGVDHLIISKQDSRVIVRVMKTNEELMIARQTRDRLTG
jgi:acetate kinase